MLGWIFLCGTSTKQTIQCLGKGHNGMPLVTLKPATTPYQVKHYTTKPLYEYVNDSNKNSFSVIKYVNMSMKNIKI